MHYLADRAIDLTRGRIIKLTQQQRSSHKNAEQNYQCNPNSVRVFWDLFLCQYSCLLTSR